MRLEARYLPHDAPTELVVRIFPDAIHADAHAEELTEREQAAGQAYWRAVWGVTDAAAITSAREWLAGRCGHYRALWVATATTPLNTPAVGDPKFPQLTLRTADEPVRAKLLPDEWMVRLYNAALTPVYTTFSSKVAGRAADRAALAGIGRRRGSTRSWPARASAGRSTSSRRWTSAWRCGSRSPTSRTRSARCS